MNGQDLFTEYRWVSVLRRKKRITSDSYIHDAPAHTEEPGHISRKSILFETIVCRQIVINEKTIRYLQGKTQQSASADIPVGKHRGHS